MTTACSVSVCRSKSMFNAQTWTLLSDKALGLCCSLQYTPMAVIPIWRCKEVSLLCSNTPDRGSGVKSKRHLPSVERQIVWIRWESRWLDGFNYSSIFIVARSRPPWPMAAQRFLFTPNENRLFSDHTPVFALQVNYSAITQLVDSDEITWSCHREKLTVQERGGSELTAEG